MRIENFESFLEILFFLIFRAKMHFQNFHNFFLSFVVLALQLADQNFQEFLHAVEIFHKNFVVIIFVFYEKIDENCLGIFVHDFVHQKSFKIQI